MITSSMRQGLYLLFIFVMLVFGIVYFKMSIFQILLIIALAGIILKLTDIQETIEGKRK
jgi:H+/gluconate symporter-like permease